MAQPGWIARENPAFPHEIVGQVREDDAAAVNAIVGQAAAAQRPWAERSLEDRIQLLSAAIDAAVVAMPDLSRLLSREMGKPIGDCAGELRFACALAADMARRAPRLLADQPRGQGPGRRIVRRIPLGVIAAIVPWNAPLVLAMTKIAPALLCGNAIVVKPSPLSPLALTALIRAIAAHLPDPVLQVVNGGAATGAALLGAEGVAKAAFTGGTSVGGEVLAQAARRFIPCIMELGGNDPLVVLGDFDPTPEAMEAIIWASFLNAGQVCMSAKRLLVPAALLPRFTESYVDAARAMFRLGDPLDPATTMGPVVNGAARERMLALAQAASRDGGQVIDLLAAGTALPDTGYFVPPRLVTGLDPSAPLVCEEQFGPILPIIGYRDEAEMLRLANHGDLALSASVWTPDIERGWVVAGKLRSGLALVNAHNRAGFSFDLPFGGMGQSGFGREYGDEGLLEYAAVQSLHIPDQSIRANAYPLPAMARAELSADTSQSQGVAR
jgi:acyl-CoA reductase-like NAD-dependent aldehyde dehydrogenase